MSRAQFLSHQGISMKNHREVARQQMGNHHKGSHPKCPWDQQELWAIEAGQVSPGKFLRVAPTKAKRTPGAASPWLA